MAKNVQQFHIFPQASQNQRRQSIARVKFLSGPRSISQNDMDKIK